MNVVYLRWGVSSVVMKSMRFWKVGSCCQVAFLNKILSAAENISVPRKLLRMKGPKWKASPEVLVLLKNCKDTYKEWQNIGKPTDHELTIVLFSLLSVEFLSYTSHCLCLPIAVCTLPLLPGFCSRLVFHKMVRQWWSSHSQNCTLWRYEWYSLRKQIK
jgi:hypothetical protein